MAAVIAALLAALQGCASRGPILEQHLDAESPRQIELGATPFFPQRQYQCGPAALAMVLTASGVSVAPDDLVGQVFALFVLTVAAAEAAIGLAILVVFFRNRGSIAVEDVNMMKG